MNMTSQGEAPKKVNWQDVQARLKEIFVFLSQYLKNPVEGIKRAPSWDWPTIFMFVIMAGALTSMLGGIIERQLLSFIAGMIVGPLAGIITSFIIAGLCYYTSLFFLKVDLDFRKLYAVVVLAMFPAQLVGVLSSLTKAITPFCILLTALFLAIGLRENFLLDKKKVTKFVGSVTAVLLVFWLYSMLIALRSSQIRIQDYTPESLDQIHKELSE